MDIHDCNQYEYTCRKDFQRGSAIYCILAGCLLFCLIVCVCIDCLCKKQARNKNYDNVESQENDMDES